jgi:class 3 adenylate cyclase/CHASE2 domain-containing sensor protein
MNKRLRSLLWAALFSLAASAIGLALFLAPPGSATFANRIADYSFVNQALHFLSDRLPNGMLGLKPVDLDAQDSNVVLVSIDEESLGNVKAGIPAWPLPRSFYGTLLEKLHAAGAKVVAFDIDFLDPSNDPSQDAAFARGLRAMPTVLPYTLSTTSLGQLGREALDPNLSPFTVRQGYTTVDNPGGMLVGQPLTIETTGTHGRVTQYTSFAGTIAAQFLGTTITPLSTHAARIGATTVPLDHRGLLLLLPFNTFDDQDISQRVGAVQSMVKFAQEQSLADVWTDSIPDLRQFVNGKIVLVGATAQALGDFIETPFGRYPGVYSNLRFIDQLLSHRFIRTPPDWVDIALILMLPFLLALVVTTGSATRSILTSFGLILLYALAVTVVYSTTLYWIDVIHVTAAMLIAVLATSAQRVISETAQRRMVTNLFGMHVSPAIVDDILSQDDPGGALALKGKKVKATIFYSDIRGFTAMSETMSPEEIYAQLNEYFEEMCAIIFEYGGYVDKFIGDCVMAVFSAPYQTPNDAANAVRAAVAQQKKILELSEKWKAQGKREFTVGMGINTGDVVMGNLGASSRMNYTVIGDNVNLAARLYNVAKAGEIIISDYTYQEVASIVVADELEPVTVKGKKDPIRIYNIRDVKDGSVPTNGAVQMEPAKAY